MGCVQSVTDRGFVYFIGTGSGPVKIGIAQDPASRLGELQVGNPESLTLFAAFDGMLEDERALHVEFAASRLCGEWFSRNRRLEALIASLRHYGNPPGGLEWAWERTRYRTEEEMRWQDDAHNLYYAEAANRLVEYMQKHGLGLSASYGVSETWARRAVER